MHITRNIRTALSSSLSSFSSIFQLFYSLKTFFLFPSSHSHSHSYSPHSKTCVQEQAADVVVTTSSSSFFSVSSNLPKLLPWPSAITSASLTEIPWDFFHQSLSQLSFPFTTSCIGARIGDLTVLHQLMQLDQFQLFSCESIALKLS